MLQITKIIGEYMMQSVAVLNLKIVIFVPERKLE